MFAFLFNLGTRSVFYFDIAAHFFVASSSFLAQLIAINFSTPSWTKVLRCHTNCKQSLQTCKYGHLCQPIYFSPTWCWKINGDQLSEKRLAMMTTQQRNELQCQNRKLTGKKPPYSGIRSQVNIQNNIE